MLRQNGYKNTSERELLDKVYDDIQELCFDVFQTSFQKWSIQARKEEQVDGEDELLWPFVGSWQTLQEGNLHEVLLDELQEKGIRPQVGREVPPEDLLARYKAVPLHCRLLYTSMERSIETSFLEHYATIESMMRDRCDMYISFQQFFQPAEESIDYLERSPILRESGVQISFSDLPGLFFWDQQCKGEFISFGLQIDDLRFRHVLKCISDEIRYEPTIAAVKRAKKRLYRKE